VLLFQKLGKITFEVNASANKISIRRAVEKIWDVKVAKIQVMNVHGKSKTFARRSFQTPDWKKAIVTLQKGYKIDLPTMFESMGSSEHYAASEQQEGKN
jgi:large subunit ribosomal protein L23